MPKDKTLSWIIIILAVALIVRIFLFLGILLRNPDFFLTDTDGYLNVADNLINHRFFSANGIKPDNILTPLYPFFMALFKWIGLSNAGVIFIQILVATATCALIILLTHQLTGNWVPACIAGGITALDIPSIVYSNCLLTETLFTFLLTLSVLYLVRYFKQHERISALFISGILMGLSILCRSIGALLPFFIVILFFLFSKMPKGRVFRRALLYLASFLIIVFPWLIRNQLVFGSLLLTPLGHHNLLHYRAAGVYAISEGISLAEANDFLTEKARSSFQGNPEEEFMKYQRFEGEMGVSIIMDHPFIYFRNLAVSVFNMFFQPIRSTIDLQLGFVEKGTALFYWGKKEDTPLLTRLVQKTSKFTIAVVVIQLVMLPILWTSFIYGIKSSFTKKDYLICGIILLAIVYFSIMSGGPEAYARFRVPLIPFLAIGGGIGIMDAYKRLKGRST